MVDHRWWSWRKPALLATVSAPHWRSTRELGVFAAEEEVLEIAFEVDGAHVAGLGGDAAGGDQAGAVNADFRTIAEAQGLAAAAGCR